jgi:hypothetical protein
MRTALASLGAVAVGLMILLGIQRIVERQRTANEINRLRDSLYRARVASDRCRGSLQTSEASLLALGETIDSLRVRVESFEAMDGRGVPAARYDEYLEIFDSYNDSVEVWEGREQRLRTTEVSCRETIEEHNAISDTLQSVLAGAGIDAG